MKLKNSCSIISSKQDSFEENGLVGDCVFEKISENLEKAYESGIRHFLCGTALSPDLSVAAHILRLKEKYPDIELECVIPFELQSEKWNELSRDRYFEIIEKSDKETLLQTRYTADCLEKSDRYLYENCQYVIFIGSSHPLISNANNDIKIKSIINTK